MRIVFMGTPDFSVPALEACLAAGHEIVRVYSQPPRPAGRGPRERRAPVHEAAMRWSLPVRTPASLKGAEAQAAFAALEAEIGVVVAYGQILPKAVLDAPRRGCLNIHASLLPRWRGAAPIQRAILAGDRETGVTIMQMDEGLDTGPMLLTRAVTIAPNTTAGDLHDSLARLGAGLIVDALAGLQAGTLAPRPQPEAGVTYAPKIDKAEARIDWRRSAGEVERQIRAFTPWPGAWSEIGGERIRILAAEIVSGHGAPGEVLDERLTVACGDGALRPSRLQRPGKAPAGAEAFLRGFRVSPGARFA